MGGRGSVGGEVIIDYTSLMRGYVNGGINEGVNDFRCSILQKLMDYRINGARC